MLSSVQAYDNSFGSLFGEMYVGNIQYLYSQLQYSHKRIQSASIWGRVETMN